MRVLFVEDDRELREVVARQLRNQGIAVDEAARVIEADMAASVHDYDCVVLDRMLPDGDALELVEGWRTAGSTVPVMFLTARSSVGDRVAGLGVGDDYLVKPFDLDELVARVRAVGRRGSRPGPVVMRWGDLEVHRGMREVRRSGVLHPLTPKEFAVLEALVEADGAVVSVSELVERCWDEHADLFSRAIYVHIAALRRKLGNPPVIRTVRGAGYALDPA